MHRKSVVLLNASSQFIGISTVSHDSCISMTAERTDSHPCNCSSALTLAAIKLLEKHRECYWLRSNPTHVYLSTSIRVFNLFSCLSHLYVAFWSLDFEGLGAKSVFPNSSHNVSPGQWRPVKATAVPALNVTTTSGDKRVVVSLEREHFQQENVMLMDSTAFIFHFDCLKDAIKKRSNLLVQVRGESRSYFLIKRRKKCFKGIWLGERCWYICLQEGFKRIACLVSYSPPPNVHVGLALPTFLFLPLGFPSLIPPPDGTVKQKRKWLWNNESNVK